jgi:hypothetical protein
MFDTKQHSFGAVRVRDFRKPTTATLPLSAQ